MNFATTSGARIPHPVAPAPNLFVAVASDGTLGDGHYAMTSPDGVTWTLQPTMPAGYDGAWRDVRWNGSVFCAVGQNNSLHSGIPDLQAQVMTSPDGAVWTKQTSACNMDWMTGIAWNGSVFAAVGVGNGSGGTNLA